MKAILKILLYIIVITIPCRGFSEAILGDDYLALNYKDFRHRDATKLVDDGQAVGTLDYTFSPSLSNTNYLLAHSNPCYLRVHILDTVCVRNRNCGSYSVVHGYSIAGLNKAIKDGNREIKRHLQSRVAIYKDIATSRPNLSVIVSPALEHNLDKEAWRQLADWTLEVWPDVQLVNNPMTGVSFERYKGAWHEDHGKNPHSDAEIVSLDGTEIMDINVTEWLRKANTPKRKIIFRWTRGYNCRHRGNFEDPRKRTACPSRRLMTQVHHATDVRPKPNKYAGKKCKRIAAYKSPKIWKPLSDDHGTGDSRANLPVAIVDFPNKDINLITYLDKPVGKLGYYGRFENGPLNRFYANHRSGSNKTGYQFEQEAVKQSGEPYAYLQLNDKCVGPFIPGQRGGATR